jgi:hypothetical protein
LKDRLPRFSESNWTSRLRRHAGLTPCADGFADFEYENDMDAFLEMFQLERRKHWKKVYIEVNRRWQRTIINFISVPLNS